MTPIPQEFDPAAVSPGYMPEALAAALPGKSRPRSLNATPLLCRQAVRETILRRAATIRPANHFTRVSEETLVLFNALVSRAIDDFVRRAPSRGRTL